MKNRVGRQSTTSRADDKADVIPKQFQLTTKGYNFTRTHCYLGTEVSCDVDAAKVHHKQLQNFKMVMMSQNVAGILEEYIWLVSFLYTLEDNARDWVNALSLGEITTWAILQTKFLEKYFPITRVRAIKREIGRTGWEKINSFMNTIHSIQEIARQMPPISNIRC